MIKPLESQGRMLRLGRSWGAERSNLPTQASMSADAHPKRENATKTSLGWTGCTRKKSRKVSLRDSQRTRNLEFQFGIQCAEETHPFEQTWSWSSCCPTEDDIDVGDDQGAWYFMQRPTQTAIPWQNEEDWNVDPPLKVPAESIWPRQHKESKDIYGLWIKASVEGSTEKVRKRGNEMLWTCLYMFILGRNGLLHSLFHLLASWLLHGVDRTAGSSQSISVGLNMCDGPVSTREESFSTCQDTKHQGQQKAGPQIKFHNIPQFGNFILNPSRLKQYKKHAKTMLMLRKLAAEGQAPALQVRDQSLCLLRAQVSCDETAHFMSSHGEQSSRGYDVVVSSATHNCFGHHKGLQHVQTCPNMSKHVQTRSNSCVQILKSENMEQSRVTWVCLQVLSASGWILACFRAHQGPTNGPRCQSSTDPHRKLSNQSRHDENFRGCESWNAQNGCNNDVAWRGMTWHDVTRVAWRGMTWHDVAWRDTIHCDMMQYDVTSVQLPVVSFCRQPDSFHHSGLLNQIWDSLWWNPKYDENTGLISSRFQFSGIMFFFFCRNASARGIRRKAASWAPGVGTQLETRRFARRALHATLRIASKSKGRFQIIWSCWISSDSNMFRDFRVSQGAKHKDDALASLKTLLTPARSVRVQRLGPPKRSKFLLGSSSGALVVRRDRAMSDHQWKIHYDSLSFNFHQVSPSIWLGLWHFDACRSSLPKPDRFKSAASNLARKPEQNKDQLNLVGILWVPPRLVFNCPLSETNVLSRPVDNKTISKHLKASSSVCVFLTWKDCINWDFTSNLCVTG